MYLLMLLVLLFRPRGLLRRTHPALRMTTPHDASPSAVAAVALAVLPFALLAVGLTLTSATEVVIFAIACMALNILVGHTGLVSFGHGAWFGLGAYAAALDAAALVSRLDAVARVGVAGIIAGRRRVIRFPRPAPPRRLLLAADARVLGAALRDRVPLDRVHRRRERAGRRHAPGLVRLDFDEPLAVLRAGGRGRALAVVHAWRFHRSPSAACSWQSARTSSARSSWAIRPDRYKLVALRVLGGADRARRHAAAFQQPHDVRRPDRRWRSRASCSPWSIIGGMRRCSGRRWARSSSCSSATTCRA